MNGTQRGLAELEAAIFRASVEAFRSLVDSHPGESFYYFALIMPSNAGSVEVAAWSYEALAASVLERSNRFPQITADSSRWSWADSPYLGHAAEMFEPANKIIAEKLQWADPTSIMSSIVKALKRASDDGVFGDVTERSKLLLNVDVTPPHPVNTEHALQLNDDTPILRQWLAEASEADS